MSELKATPGPWVVRDGFDSRPVVQRGYEGGFVVTGTSDEQEIYDAHLIASAPELYEELEKARKTIQHLINEGLVGYVDQRTNIDAALAKARGES